MSAVAELFAGTHLDAVARAEALEAGRETAAARHLGLTDVGPFDLEQVGEIAARAVRFGSGDLELAEVDLEHDTLLRLPDFLCQVLAALGADEDPDLLAEVAAEWAEAPEISQSAARLTPILTSIVDLVTDALDEDLDVFWWAEAP